MEVERQNQISREGKKKTVKKEGESNRKGKRRMKRGREGKREVREKQRRDGRD